MRAICLRSPTIATPLFPQAGRTMADCFIDRDPGDSWTNINNGVLVDKRLDAACRGLLFRICRGDGRFTPPKYRRRIPSGAASISASSRPYGRRVVVVCDRLPDGTIIGWRYVIRSIPKVPYAARADEPVSEPDEPEAEIRPPVGHNRNLGGQ
jgi:hypothetical protein